MLKRLIPVLLALALGSCVAIPSDDEVATYLVMMDRIGPPFCIATCRGYQFYLFESGEYIFLGQGGAYPKGITRGHVSLEVVEQFREMFITAKFFEYQDEYWEFGSGTENGNAICQTFYTDQGEDHLVFRHEGRTKSVFLDWGCSGFERDGELRDLILTLDSMPIIEKWKAIQRPSR